MLLKLLSADTGCEIAAVIMEPIMCNCCVIEPKRCFLERVRELCSDHGIVLVFDEVITGFRVGLSGAQGYCGVTPELAVFAKAMGAGFPISCLVGRGDFMDLIGSGRVMHGGTYNSNLVSCAASLAALQELAENDGAVFKHIDHLGNRLMAELKGLAEKKGIPLHVQGLPSVFTRPLLTHRTLIIIAVTSENVIWTYRCSLLSFYTSREYESLVGERGSSHLHTPTMTSIGLLRALKGYSIICSLENGGRFLVTVTEGTLSCLPSDQYFVRTEFFSPVAFNYWIYYLALMGKKLEAMEGGSLRSSSPGG